METTANDQNEILNHCRIHQFLNKATENLYKIFLNRWSKYKTLENRINENEWTPEYGSMLLPLCSGVPAPMAEVMKTGIIDLWDVTLTNLAIQGVSKVIKSHGFNFDKDEEKLINDLIEIQNMVAHEKCKLSDAEFLIYSKQLSNFLIRTGDSPSDIEAFKKSLMEFDQQKIPESNDEKSKFNQLKNDANKFYLANKFVEAIDVYNKALEIPGLSPESQAIIYSNRSAAYLMVKTPNSLLMAKRDAEWAIQLWPCWWRGYFRLGRAQVELKEWNAAEKSLLQALALNPESKEARDELSFVRSKIGSISRHDPLNPDIQPKSMEEILKELQIRMGISEEQAKDVYKKGLNMPGFSDILKGHQYRDGMKFGKDFKKDEVWIIELKVQIMNGKKLKIKANPLGDVSKLKETIMKKYAIPVNHQHLFYNCKLLEENYNLVYYEVENGVTLKMNLGETIERCDFYCIRSDLFDENAEQLEYEPETMLSLCKLGNKRPTSRDNACLTIQIMDGRSFTIQISTLVMVGKLKEAIAEQEKIPIEHQHLFYNCQMLNSSRTLVCYEICEGSRITMNLGMSMTGCRFYYVHPDLFDMQYSCDYINTNLQNQIEMFCAGKPYIRPIEARRFAIKVRGKYENNKWLGQPSTSNRIIPDEWPMAYHGTSEANILKIVESGFDLRKCVRMAYGKGIYCSPDPNTALMYSSDYQCEINKTGTYRVILQCRANPKNLKVVRAGDNHLGEYWTLENGDDLRPYGVCVYFYPNGYQHRYI